MNAITVTPKDQLKEIERGCEEIISVEELSKKLERSYKTQKPLVAKFGADPSRPDIHLGHTVVINKLKQLQEFGHTIKFIIGDFTARIGDPTGKSKTRPQLTKEEVETNAQTYKEQIFKILDPQKTDVVYNSTWLDALTPMDFVRLMASRTVQQVLARDDFSKRFEEQTPIFLHEFIYPILQGYDSVVLKADIELGGTDQKFNFLLARELQKHVGLEPQNIMIMPILEGLDGVQKMSKSLDNYISLTDSPKDMFGKTMSVSDPLMLRFYELLSRRSLDSLATLKADLVQGRYHPMEAKKDLAQELVERFWGKDLGAQERKNFDAVFSKKHVPTDMIEKKVTLSEAGTLNLLQFCVDIGFVKTKSEARRNLEQNGIRLNDTLVTMENLPLEKNREYVLKQGKLKYVKILT